MENLNLNETAVFYLSIIRKWTKFISVVMFIGIGLMLIAGIFMGFIMSMVGSMAAQAQMPLPGSFFTVIYIIMAVIYFFPVLYLYRFSEYLGNALLTGSTEELTNSLRYLKNHYNYIGVLLIISLALMVLVIIGAILAGIFGLAASSGGNFL
jgi:hypothetical protein